MTRSERRWKWVKTEALPEDLKNLMDKLKGGKKPKDDKGGDDGEKRRQKGPGEVDDNKEMQSTQIKRDYLSIDFTLFPNVSEIVEALKQERMKPKYSAIYHAQVFQKIFDVMPC